MTMGFEYLGHKTISDVANLSQEWSRLQKLYSPRNHTPPNPLQMWPWKIIGGDKPPRKWHWRTQRTTNRSILAIQQKQV